MFKRLFRSFSTNFSIWGCLAATTKPVTGVEFGDLCIELDSGDIYAFNGTAWVKSAIFKV